MRENIRNLVRLQEIAFEMRDLEARRAQAPAALAELELSFQQTREEIGAARLKHESLVDQRHQLSEERQEAAERRAKAQKKLMTVSNQREYSAVLNEIDATEALLAKLDEDITQCNVEIEQLEGPATEADTHIAVEQEKLEAAKARIEKDLGVAVTRLDELVSQRETLVIELPVAEVRRFDAVFRARGGIAMAAVEKGACSACHVRLRPQIISLARRGTELVTCDSCRRFLYVADKPSGADEIEEAPAAESSGSVRQPNQAG